MTIDWSKAPADATHFSPADGYFVDLWAKMDGECWMYTESALKPWHHGRAPADGENYIKRPSPWTGEGLPPVGAACELSVSEKRWFEVTVNFIGKELLIAKVDGQEICRELRICRFRPIRTPEQIAAEDRENYVQIAMGDTRTLGISDTSKRILIERLYDSGHRKQVTS